MEGGGDHGHPVDRLDLGERLEVLLGAADVGLQAGVPTLDDVTGAGLVPAVPFQVPVHDVPSAGAETQFHRSRVDHHLVAGRDGPGELQEGVRAFRTVAEVDFDALEPGPRFEQSHDLPGSKRRHVERLRVRSSAQRLAMRRSTRSSRDLNGSLHNTVRCAWSLSFRWTQSTV